MNYFVPSWIMNAARDEKGTSAIDKDSPAIITHIQWLTLKYLIKSFILLLIVIYNFDTYHSVISTSMTYDKYKSNSNGEEEM